MMAIPSSVIGIFFAVLSAIGNGSFTVPSKMPVVKHHDVDPVIFNFYTCIGVLLSSLIPLFFYPFYFTWYGILSGVLFALSASSAFAAVGLIGISVAQGLWCGLAVVVSFTFGQVFDTKVSHFVLAIVGIAILVVAICGIASTGSSEESRAETESLLGPGETRHKKRHAKAFVGGTLAALVAGLFGGLILAPMTFAPKNTHGLPYLPTFGIGAMIGGAVVLVLVLIVKQHRPLLLPQYVALPGVLSGLIYSAANACSILAMSYVSYSIAYPIMQCGLFVAGMWGLLLFKEIEGKRAIVYWVSGAVLLCGAIILSISQ